MQYRIDPKSGNKLPALGMGCMRFPTTLGRIDMNKTEALILKAFELGINYFDTAYVYPGSEEALGQIIHKHNLRDKIYIATKLPLRKCNSYDNFNQFFDIQLERLRTGQIDYYFIHSISGPKQWKQLCDLGIEKWITEKKQSRQIQNIGFSFHGKRDDFLALLDQYEWDFCQIQYNYINTHYQAGVTGLKAAAKKGIPVFIMEPLLGGKLASELPKKAKKEFQKVNEHLSTAGWAFRWLWNQPEVTLVLSGMNHLSQIEENVSLVDDATPGILSREEIQTFENVMDIFNAYYKIPCTGCNYCMPCPKGINIPACFSAYNTSYSIGITSGFQMYFMSTEALSPTPHLASNCVKCGKCEAHCPQNIPIRDGLHTVRKRMEPFFMKPLLSILKKLYS